MDGLLTKEPGNSYTRAVEAQKDGDFAREIGDMLSAVSIPLGLIMNPSGVANQVITDLAVEGIKGTINLLFPESSADQQSGDAPNASQNPVENIASSTRFNLDPTLNTIVTPAIANTVSTPAHANNPGDQSSGVISTITSMPSPGTSVEDPRNSRDTSVATSLAA